MNQAIETLKSSGELAADHRPVDGRPGRRARAAIAARSSPALARAASPARRRAGAATGASSAIAAVSTVVVLGLLITVDRDERGLAERPRDVLQLGRLQGRRSRTCSTGFWLDVKLFVIVEIACSSSGCSSRWRGISRTPALFPLRLLSAVFVDVLRGVPTILVVYLIGFGVPALMLSGLPTDPVVLGGIALDARLLAPTSARSTARASSRSTRASAPPRSPSG